jgi:ribosome-associated translation inhibitor RaiA
MAIEIRGVPVDSALRKRIAVRLMTALARSTTKAGGAHVTFFDENGPKGGPAMRCAMTVRLPNRRGVRAEDTAETLRNAFEGAFANLERELQRDRDRERESKRHPKKYYTAARLMAADTGGRPAAKRPPARRHPNRGA